MDAQVQERELDFQQVWQMFAETRAQIEASDVKLTRQIEASDAKLTRLFAETDEQFKETDERVKETSRQVGSLGDKWRQFVERLVAPAALRMFAERGISLDEISQRTRRSRNGENMEVDVLAFNSEYAVVIEVKSTLTMDDVRRHLERLDDFKRFFIQHAGRKVVGAVAGIVIKENTEKFASNHGLFVIRQSGDVVELANDAAFQPKLW